MNIFLYGMDTIEDVRDIRATALGKLNGVVTEWSANNLTSKRVLNIPLEKILTDANEFLRKYDPEVRKKNPIVIKTKPFIV